MAELKKCPFCGGVAEYNKETEFDTHGDMYTSHYVWCPYPKNGCGARIYGHSKQEVIERWNNRTTEAEIRNKTIDEFVRKLLINFNDWQMSMAKAGNEKEYETIGKAIIGIEKIAERLKACE